MVLDADGAAAGHVPQDAHPRRPALLREVLLHARRPRLPAPSTSRSARSGTLICWDQWYPEAARPHRARRRGGALLPDRDRLASSGEGASTARRSTPAWQTIQRSARDRQRRLRRGRRIASVTSRTGAATASSSGVRASSSIRPASSLRASTDRRGDPGRRSATSARSRPPARTGRSCATAASTRTGPHAALRRLTMATLAQAATDVHARRVPLLRVRGVAEHGSGAAGPRRDPGRARPRRALSRHRAALRRAKGFFDARRSTSTAAKGRRPARHGGGLRVDPRAARSARARRSRRGGAATWRRAIRRSEPTASASPATAWAASTRCMAAVQRRRSRRLRRRGTACCATPSTTSGSPRESLGAPRLACPTLASSAPRTPDPSRGCRKLRGHRHWQRGVQRRRADPAPGTPSSTTPARMPTVRTPPPTPGRASRVPPARTSHRRGSAPRPRWLSARPAHRWSRLTNTAECQEGLPRPVRRQRPGALGAWSSAPRQARKSSSPRLEPRARNSFPCVARREAPAGRMGGARSACARYRRSSYPRRFAAFAPSATTR